MSEPRVLLMTGDQRRHRYVARRLAQSLQLVGSVREVKAPVIPSQPKAVQDLDIMQRHLHERDVVELELLGDPEFAEVPRHDVPHGHSNSAEVLDWVRSLAPDYVILYGTSIIKLPLLSAFEGRMINMHLGLSPYYRGTATNYWPLVNGEPELVGVTIHLAIAQVDAGAILRQVRPTLLPSDRAHEAGTKAMMAGVGVIPHTLRDYDEGTITPQAQEKRATRRLYTRKDFDAESIRTLWRRFDAGMMADFCAHPTERCARFPIVE